MKLYIIGNGFDLNHGMPTSYYDYREFLRNKAPKLAEEYEHCEYIYAAEFDYDTKWNDVEEGIRLNYDDAFYDMGQTYYPDMSSEHTPGWDDIRIETEIRFGFLQDFTKKYFFDWISIAEHVCKKVIQSYYTLERTDAYISFNYTNTLEIVYGIPEQRVFHIHGNINSRDGIQFGNTENNPTDIQEELEKRFGDDDFYNVVFEPAVSSMTTYALCTYKSIESNISLLESFVNNCGQISEVVIMGHMLLGIDDPYYEKVLVPYFGNCIWSFYLHSQEDSDRAKGFIQRYKIKNVQFRKW